MNKKVPSSHSAPISPQRWGWAAAVAAGLCLTGCPDEKSQQDTENPAPKAAPAAADAGGKDKECCMGLNDCKGKGGCAVPESNSCAGKNDCKGKGGCNMHCPK
jgi:hypothetical protein